MFYQTYFSLIVYERPLPSHFCHDFVLISVLGICFLYSINDVHPDPLSSPGELCFFRFLFILYTTKELHALNNCHVLTIKFFLIKIKIVLVLH